MGIEVGESLFVKIITEISPNLEGEREREREREKWSSRYRRCSEHQTDLTKKESLHVIL
jgi:hypothetical protein